MGPVSLLGNIQSKSDYLAFKNFDQEVVLHALPVSLSLMNTRGF